MKTFIKAGNKAGEKQNQHQHRGRPLYDKLRKAAPAGQILDNNEKLLDNRVLDGETILKAIFFFKLFFCNNHKMHTFRLLRLIGCKLI